MSKYPPFEKLTAGGLHVGDRILIRDGVQDREYLMDDDGRVLSPTWGRDPKTGQYGELDEGEFLPPGIHAITDIYTYLRHGSRRASRYYTLTFDNGQRVNSSHVSRWNRVTS